MGKQITITCDRCNQIIIESDQRIIDCLSDQYPDQDICQRCDREIVLRQEVARRAALLKISELQVIEEWLALYTN